MDRYDLTRLGAGALRIAGLAAIFATTAVAADAQQLPPYAAGPAEPPAPPPSYAEPREPMIRGVVARIDGKYQIHVHDRNGYLDNVTLHQGTIINPTGLPLAPGERVVILGHPAGGAFEANEIDVPGAVGYVVRPCCIGPAFGVGFGYGGRWGGGWRGGGWW